MVAHIFTARWWQVAAYLFGVALFSISFMVFLNSTMSFVITDLIGSKKHVGTNVGNLGFADELVALIACPFWGVVSDRLGVRLVTMLGYTLIGISLFVFVQARNIYPQLLLARLLFSLGGAACTTMVTAILPVMIWSEDDSGPGPEASQFRQYQPATASRSANGAASSDATVAQNHYQTNEVTTVPAVPVAVSENAAAPLSKGAVSITAGLVGMFTGVGALVALCAFLPLPAQFQKVGQDPATAIIHSYYVVGSIAFVVAIICYFGLSKLTGEEGKGFLALFNISAMQKHKITKAKALSYTRAFFESVTLAGKDMSIGLGYLGGFVARASSVAISTFIPLYVNTYFIESGMCSGSPADDIKHDCRQAYVSAAILTGTSQLVALICAPIFGFLDVRARVFNAPIMVASAAGIIGYTVFARLRSPLPGGDHGTPAVYLLMVLIGISQIGAIVCSLSMLGRGIQGEVGGGGKEWRPQSRSAAGPSMSSGTPIERTDSNGRPLGASLEEPSLPVDERRPLLSRRQISRLPSHLQSLGSDARINRGHLKGSIAGLYSLSGGAGILLLTKLGGWLFDKTSTGAPFIMMAVFNAILFVAALGCGVATEMARRKTVDYTLGS